MSQRRLLLFALLSLGFAPSQEAATRVEAVLEAELQAGRIPGAAVAVARDGKIAFSKGCGQATAATVFRIGSITKQFTAAAILLLRDEGKLSVDDPLSKFLPEFPHGKDVSIRHLLTHTSGIKSFTSLKEYRTGMAGDRTPEEMIQLFRDQPVDFPPGEKFLYNNSGFFLLGVIIEKASGTTYAEFLKKRLFAPAGMESTWVDAPKLEVARRATGYKKVQEEWKEADPISMTQPGGAGAMISTVEDLLKWDAALHGGTLLKKESLAEMTTPSTLKDGKATRYGFGLFIEGQGAARVIGHGGGINGFVSYLGRFPERGLSVAVLVNSEGYDARGLANKVLKAYAGE
jgi:D-alanyl-D-alanine carboxypeptidase